MFRLHSESFPKQLEATFRDRQHNASKDLMKLSMSVALGRRMVEITNNEMITVAREVLGMTTEARINATAEDKRFRGFFGAPIDVTVIIWNELQPIDEPSAEPKHLLWALVFLKIYATEEVHCRIVGWPNPKTFRKWSWFFVTKISDMKDAIIVFDRRFDGFDGSTNCLISVDGTDCPVNEPWPFDRKWYSHKFNGPGVKYEVGVCIATGFIVWINGPFVCSTNDATIFNGELANLLTEDEGVEVDGGYKGSAKFKTPSVSLSRTQRKQKASVRARHENVNARLKVYNVLNIPFRHLNPRLEMMEKHRKCFFAVAVITQTKLQNGESLYDVEYSTSYV
jgi:DDE superfamily endonuclease